MSYPPSVVLDSPGGASSAYESNLPGGINIGLGKRLKRGLINYLAVGNFLRQLRALLE